MRNFDKDDLSRVIKQALAEDIGEGDITSELTIPAEDTAEMQFIAGEELVACGMFIPEAVFTQLSSFPEFAQRILGESSLDRPRIFYKNSDDDGT